MNQDQHYPAYFFKFIKGENMKITIKKLKKLNACSDAIEEFKSQKPIELIQLIKKIIKTKNDTYLSWANWLIVRCMTYKQYVGYAIYAARQVLDIFEKKYPKDKRPRQAINTALKCLKNPIKKNKAAASSASVSSAYAANDDAAAYASSSVSSAYAYAYAAAAYAASSAAAAAKLKMKIKILKYGIKLLRNK